MHGHNSPLIAQTLINIGDVHLDQKAYKVALTCFTQALGILEQEKGKHHVELMSVLTSMAKIHMERKEYDIALSIYTRQLDISEKNYGGEDERVAQALGNVGMVHQSAGNYEKALPYHLRELRIMEKLHGKVSLKVADVLMVLGVLFVYMDKPEVGLALFKRCFILRRDFLGSEAESTLEARGWIVDLSDDDEAAIEFDKMRLDNVPLPPEVDTSVLDQPRKNISISLPPIGGSKTPSSNVVKLPAIGGAKSNHSMSDIPIVVTPAAAATPPSSSHARATSEAIPPSNHTTISITSPNKVTIPAKPVFITPKAGGSSLPPITANPISPRSLNKPPPPPTFLVTGNNAAAASSDAPKKKPSIVFK